MCGRYVIYDKLTGGPVKLLGQELPINYNAAPSEILPIVRLDEAKQPKITAARWGLLPAWAKDTKIKPFFNARADNLEGNKVFWSSRDRHALIFISGFVEWSEHDKTPYYIYSESQPLLYVAGLWRRWQRDDQVIDSYCVITTKPHPVLTDIHHRSPVILGDKQTRREWLSKPYEDTKHLLTPYQGELTKHEVSKAINNARNKAPDLIQPV